MLSDTRTGLCIGPIMGAHGKPRLRGESIGEHRNGSRIITDRGRAEELRGACSRASEGQIDMRQPTEGSNGREGESSAATGSRLDYLICDQNRDRKDSVLQQRTIEAGQYGFIECIFVEN